MHEQGLRNLAVRLNPWIWLSGMLSETVLWPCSLLVYILATLGKVRSTNQNLAMKRYELKPRNFKSLSLSLSSLSLSFSFSLSLSHIVVQSKQVGKNQAKTLGLDQTMSPTPSPLGFFPTLMTSALPIINAAIWSAKRINTIVRVLHFIATFLWWSRLSIFSW